jgi:hypothetical protein
LEQEIHNFILIEDLEYIFHDEDIKEEAEDKEEIAVYEWYPPEFIEGIDKLMAQKPIDLPVGMSLTVSISVACLKPMINV